YFDDPAALPAWFAQLLRSAMVATITGVYHDFGALGRDALLMTAQRQGITVSPTDQDEILATMRRLPPHPEVPDSLARLQAAGLRLATLTNSPPWMLKEQMANSGLENYFEQTLSVHPTQRFKPAPEPYRHAAEQLGVNLSDICMVAAHDWDIAGAQAAGCATAFIARPGMVLGPLQKKPDLIGPDLASVTDQILL
ncbi:MAG: haloacid dehalogenase type II, partial [Anaerolineaceae bacterium]